MKTHCFLHVPIRFPHPGAQLYHVHADKRKATTVWYIHLTATCPSYLIQPLSYILYSLCVNFERKTIRTNHRCCQLEAKKKPDRNTNRGLAPRWQNTIIKVYRLKSNLLPCKCTEVEVLRLFTHGRKWIATPSFCCRVSTNLTNLQILCKELGDTILHAKKLFQSSGKIHWCVRFKSPKTTGERFQCSYMRLFFRWFGEVLLHSTCPSFLFYMVGEKNDWQEGLHVWGR